MANRYEMSIPVLRHTSILYPRILLENERLKGIMYVYNNDYYWTEMTSTRGKIYKLLYNCRKTP